MHLDLIFFFWYLDWKRDKNTK